jgi:hypothetical protein
MEMEKDTNKPTRVHILDIVKKEYLAVRKHFNLSKIRAFLWHMKAEEEGTGMIKGEFFMSLSREDRDKLLLELIAIKGIDLYIIKDKSGV